MVEDKLVRVNERVQRRLKRRLAIRLLLANVQKRFDFVRVGLRRQRRQEQFLQRRLVVAVLGEQFLEAIVRVANLLVQRRVGHQEQLLRQRRLHRPFAVAGRGARRTAEGAERQVDLTLHTAGADFDGPHPWRRIVAVSSP